MNSERGASAVIVAGMLVLFFGIAAFAVDLGAGFSSRRGNQTAADVGVMAGAVEALSGAAGIRDQALNYVRLNLDETYSAGEWSTLWTNCADGELAALNGSGFNFQPVASPWGGGTLNCLSIDPAGYIRVRVPDQIVETSFAPVIGVDEIETNAAAIARLAPRGDSGVLPFGLPSTASDGDHLCLSDGPSGLASDPCDGPSTGNFGTLDVPLFGNSELGTGTMCGGNPNTRLAVNIAAGVDHLIVADPDNSDANEVRDQCFNLGVDTLNTDPGFPSATETGLVTGPVSYGFTPRLGQGGPFRTVEGNSVNDQALWIFINPSLPGSPTAAPGTVPDSCVRSTFATSRPDFDWDGDGDDDRAPSWEHMARCLQDYDAGGWTTVMFNSSIAQSPRFSYSPQFWSSSLGPGSRWLHILRFKAVYVEGGWWKKGNDWIINYPGEQCQDKDENYLASCNGAGNYALKQVSAFVIPDASLPDELKGSPGPSGGLNPYETELYR